MKSRHCVKTSRWNWYRVSSSWSNSSRASYNLTESSQTLGSALSSHQVSGWGLHWRGVRENSGWWGRRAVGAHISLLVNSFFFFSNCVFKLFLFVRAVHCTMHVLHVGCGQYISASCIDHVHAVVAWLASCAVRNKPEGKAMHVHDTYYQHFWSTRCGCALLRVYMWAVLFCLCSSGEGHVSLTDSKRTPSNKERMEGCGMSPNAMIVDTVVV